MKEIKSNWKKRKTGWLLESLWSDRHNQSREVLRVDEVGPKMFKGLLYSNLEDMLYYAKWVISEIWSRERKGKTDKKVNTYREIGRVINTKTEGESKGEKIRSKTEKNEVLERKKEICFFYKQTMR